MTGLKLNNSPLSNLNYRLHKRLVFLYAALRTRSLYSRDALARLATGFADYDLLLSLEAAVTVKNRRAFLDLIWLVSNQAIHEHDLQNALRLYRIALERWGMGRLAHIDRANLSILAIKLDDLDLAEAAASKLPNLYGLVKNLLPNSLDSVLMQSVQEAMHATVMLNKDYSVASAFLAADVANPFRGLSHREAQVLAKEESSKTWLERLSRELVDSKLEKLSFTKPIENWQTPLDLLQAPSSVESATNQPLVSIVISAYKPERSIFTAVNSALAQTHQNLEILVIDDCSGDDYEDILNEVAALDSRVKVLHQKTNGGTYRIRNRALDEATGEFITFQDSDDWMHPSRIELQVQNLQKNPKRVANISLSTRLTDRLEAVESNRRLRIGICEPALMFRRELVRDKIGYFDNVRKGGDSEFRKRLMKAFDQDCAVVHPFKVLTIQRADNGGLTQGELGYRWIAEFRLVYRDSYLYWQRTAGKAQGYRVSSDEQPHFYSPRQSRMGSAQARSLREFDVVFGVNLRDAKNVPVAVAAIEAAAKLGKSVGILQLNNLYPLKQPSLISGKALQLLNDNKAEMVFAQDEIVARRFELLAPSAWLLGSSGQSFDWQISETSVVAIEKASEAFIATGQYLAEELEQSVKNAFRR